MSLSAREDVLGGYEDECPELLDLVWDMGFEFEDLGMRELDEQVIRLYTGVGVSSWDERLENGWFHARDVPGDDTVELYFSSIWQGAEGYARDKYGDPAVMEVEIPWSVLEFGQGEETGKVYRSEDVSTDYYSTGYPVDWVSEVEEL